MGDFVQYLKSNKILTAQDIIRLRTYIENKYPNSDVNKQADILINSIRSVIDGYLKSIPRDHQHKIRETLLKNKLLYKQETIVLYDIFETFITINVEDSNFLNVILDWVNCYLDKPISKEDLSLYFPHIEENDTILLKTEYGISSIINPEVIEENYTASKEENILSKQFNFKKIKSSFQLSSINVLFTGLFLLIFFSFFVNYLQSNSVKAEEEDIIVKIETIEYKHPYLPSYFRYKNIDENKLKTYLKSRDSLLEEEPYFSSIINTSREFDLNPLILFAIAGHEQGFVPKTNPSSKEIINNPFNVFISWQEYNTDIIDSSQIAARTVINLSKDRPDEIDPFQWINRKYAEDKNWWKGVRSIFNRLEREVNNFSSE